MEEKREQFAQTDISEVFAKFHSSAQGLATPEAQERLAQYGPNKIKKAQAESER